MNATPSAPVVPGTPRRYAPEVRAQYEQYPYPPRNPDDERERLCVSHPDFLPLVSQTCFAGRRDFRRGGRLLVAGSGTGDSEIYLAEQLRGTDSEIIAVDLSESSIEIARRRAAVRKLENIQWVHASLLDLPALGLGTFDYVSCCGVLHHLEDPDAGLRALRGVLRPDGAMSIMVYGQYGRTGVYQMQELMRRINRDEPDLAQQVANARSVLRHLPATNWFARAQDLVTDHIEFGDVGIYDLLLHPVDRAYTVPQLFAWLDRCDLAFLDFSYWRSLYDPTVWIEDEALRRVIATKPRAVQYAIAELLVGCIYTHRFYCAPDPDRLASADDEEMVPFLWMDQTHGDLAAALTTGADGPPVEVVGPTGARYTIVPDHPCVPELFRHVDGHTAIGDIARRTRKALGGRYPLRTIKAAFARQYSRLRAFDLMVLRHRSVPAYKSPDELARAMHGS